MQIADALRAYNYMKAFSTSYEEYLNTDERVIDMLLIIEHKVQEENERKTKVAERKASGSPVQSRV